jgi:hypothetical protein
MTRTSNPRSSNRPLPYRVERHSTTALVPGEPEHVLSFATYDQAVGHARKLLDSCKRARLTTYTAVIVRDVRSWRAVWAGRVNRPAENTCEHGDHPAPPGRRFCSRACQDCEAGMTPCSPECRGAQ